MKKQFLNDRGFTLVEIVITTAIVGGIAIVLLNIYQDYSTVLAIQQARVSVSGSARAVVDGFKQAALQASHVVTAHTFSGVTYTTGGAVVVLELPSVDSAGDAIAGAHDYIAFYASSTSAYKITDGGNGSVRVSGTRHLSDTLDTLTFTYNNSNAAFATSTDIDIQTRAVVRGQTVSAHVHETARLRNL